MKKDYKDNNKRNVGVGNDGNWNNGNFNKGYFNSGDHNDGTLNSGIYNSGNGNTGHYNDGNRNSGSFNIGNFNTGDFNKNSFSNGCFNTSQEKTFMFNKASEWTMKDWFDSDAKRILFRIPCYGCSENEKNSEQKMQERQEWWNNLPEEKKNIVKSIPNFDSEIFNEITGIEIE